MTLRRFEVHRPGGIAIAPEIIEAEVVNFLAGGAIVFSRDRPPDEYATDKLVLFLAPGTWEKVNSIEWRPL